MYLSLIQSPQMILQCLLCERSMADHEESCPQGKLDALLADTHQLGCPCCRGRIQINTSDFYECRKCKTQFCTGQIVPGVSDPESNLTKHTILDFAKDTHHLMYQLKEKGKGEFKVDLMIKALKEQIKLIKRNKRKRKRKE